MDRRLSEVCRSDVEKAIHEWIIGRHAERDRAILSRRLFDGICLEPLAEEFGLSVAQVKRIVNRCSDIVFRHIR